MVAQRQAPEREGFTLVEIMIVVAIIAILTSIAIPAFIQYRKDAQDTLYVNELRVMRDSLKTYNLKTGQWPPDVGNGVCPAGMSNYFEHVDWSKPAPIGGVWNWDANVLGFKAGISVVSPNRTSEEMKRIDSVIDDGNLQTGTYQLTSPVGVGGANARYTFIIE